MTSTEEPVQLVNMVKVVENGNNLVEGPFGDGFPIKKKQLETYISSECRIHKEIEKRGGRREERKSIFRWRCIPAPLK